MMWSPDIYGDMANYMPDKDDHHRWTLRFSTRANKGKLSYIDIDLLKPAITHHQQYQIMIPIKLMT